MGGKSEKFHLLSIDTQLKTIINEGMNVVLPLQNLKFQRRLRYHTHIHITPLAVLVAVPTTEQVPPLFLINVAQLRTPLSGVHHWQMKPTLLHTTHNPQMPTAVHGEEVQALGPLPPLRGVMPTITIFLHLPHTLHCLLHIRMGMGEVQDLTSGTGTTFMAYLIWRVPKTGIASHVHSNWKALGCQWPGVLLSIRPLQASQSSTRLMGITIMLTRRTLVMRTGMGTIGHIVSAMGLVMGR